MVYLILKAVLSGVLVAAISEVAKRYPKQPAAFNERLQAERQKTNCPA